MGVALGDKGAVGVARQQPCDHRRIKPRLARKRGEDAGVANVAALTEVGTKKRGDHRALPPLQPRPMDQAVGIQCVGRACDPVQVQRHSGGRRMFDKRQIGLHRPLLAAELRLQIGAAVHPLWRHVRVQLERMPFDGEGMIGPGLQRAVQTDLAKIAPGADWVGQYIKPDQCVFSHSSRRARRLVLPVAVRGIASRCR